MDVDRFEGKIVYPHLRSYYPAVRSSNSPRLCKKTCYDEPESRVRADTTLVRVVLKKCRSATPVDVLELVVRMSAESAYNHIRRPSLRSPSGLNSQSAIRSARRNLLLVTRAAWECLEFLIKRVGDSRSFHFLSSVFSS